MGNVLPYPLPHLQRWQLDGGTSLIHPLRIIQWDIGHEELLSIVGFAKKPVIDIVIQFGIVKKVVVPQVGKGEKALLPVSFLETMEKDQDL